MPALSLLVVMIEYAGTFSRINAAQRGPMDADDQEVANSGQLKFLLRDIRIPADFPGEKKSAESRSLADFFLDWSGVRGFSGDFRFAGQLKAKKGTVGRRSTTTRAAASLFWCAYFFGARLADLKEDIEIAANMEDAGVQKLSKKWARFHDALVAFRDEFDLDSIEYPRGSQGLHVELYVRLMASAAKLLLLLGMESMQDENGKVSFNPEVKRLLEKACQDIVNEDVVELGDFSTYLRIKEIQTAVLRRTFSSFSNGCSLSMPGKSASELMQGLLDALSNETRTDLGTFLSERMLDDEEFLKDIRIYYNHLVERDAYVVSAYVAAGVVLNTYAHYVEEQGRHLTAFLSSVKAMGFLDKAARCFGQCVDVFDKLPCCSEWEMESHESEIKETIMMWERAKKDQIVANRWADIRAALEMLEEIAGDMGMLDTGMKDADGDWHEEFTYFERQYGFCEGQSEQGRAIADFFERKENRAYRNRLEKDFFPGLWDHLAIKTQRALLEAELKWDKAVDIGSDYDSIVVEYRRALEIELREAVFSQAEDVVENLIRQKKLLGPPGVKYSASNLTLTHMKRLLEDAAARESDLSASELRKRIHAIPMPSAKSAGFRDHLLGAEFCQFITELNKKRNDYEHDNETEVGEALRGIRNRILGISSIGYLPLLASIKNLPRPRAT